jgi:hypothetical protein
MFSMKVGENAEGSVASKASQMRNSDALLSLVGEIIHGDSDHWEISPTKQHGIGSVQSRCARHLTR